MTDRIKDIGKRILFFALIALVWMSSGLICFAEAENLPSDSMETESETGPELPQADYRSKQWAMDYMDV